MTRATLPQFLARRAHPPAYPSLFQYHFEKRMDGGGSRRAEALLPLKARRTDRDDPGIIWASAARHRPNLAQLS
jgi:hypothetical protein